MISTFFHFLICTVFFHNLPHDDTEEIYRNIFLGYHFTQHFNSTAVKDLLLFDTIHWQKQDLTCNSPKLSKAIVDNIPSLASDNSLQQH